jgi:hypothetical protein
MENIEIKEDLPEPEILETIKRPSIMSPMINLKDMILNDDIKQIIRETDLEIRIKTIQFIICEIKTNKDTPHTLYYCIQEIKNAIKDIRKELEQIQYRINYNNSLLVGATFRKYKFHNNKLRLVSLIKTLDNRYNMLLEILKIENNMFQNKDITNYLIFEKNDDKLIENNVCNNIDFLNDSNNSDNEIVIQL